MTRRAAPNFGTAALIAQIVLFYAVACSSADGTGSGGGTGGSSATGTGGSSATGTGGSSGTGTGGTGSTGPVGDACVNVKNKAACTGTEAPCWNTCGPLKSGYKNCVCTAGLWSCPTCAYYPE